MVSVPSFKEIVERAMAKAGPANISKRDYARKYPSKRSNPMFEKGKRFFLDVGSWQGDYKGTAHTYFGIVSGRFVLLCSWLNMEKRPCYFKYRRKNKGAEFTKKTTDFFAQAQQTATIVAHFEAFTPFASENEMFLFLPDLHLHLCKETVIDNFQYNQNYLMKNKEPKKVSLEGELAKLLKAAQSVGAKIIQVGDCFEVWEMQAHLIKDYEDLKQFYDEHYPWDKSYWQWRKDSSLINAIEYLISKRKMVPRENYSKTLDDFRYVVGRFKKDAGIETLDMVKQHAIQIDDATLYNLLSSTQDPAKLKFLPRPQVDEVVFRIMEKYPKIFSNSELNYECEGRLPFRWLRGNHDNMRANNYYTYAEKKDYEFHCSSVKKRACIIPPNKVDAYDLFKGGIDNCIWAEHGHRLDSMNSDDVFDGEKKGYYYTMDFTTGRIIGEGGWRQGAILLELQEILSEYYYMRGEQLNLAADIFEKNDEIRLIVMGHTHEAALIDWGIFLRALKQESLGLGHAFCKAYGKICFLADASR